ncbi:MAG: hypothetical protein D6808_04490, partial [Candidatus Dadabacteria bacterium]
MYREYPATHIFVELKRDNLLPAILFRTSRKQCDNDIITLAKSRGCVLSPQEQLSLRKEVLKVIDKYKMDREIVFAHPQYPTLIQSGVGAHHAGQLLIWRLLLEELMSRGVLRLMVATGTVAAGVDFPARTVVITAHSRRGNDGFRLISASELQQMSGRAGRRGKDTVGFCIVAPSIYSDARVIAEVAKKPPEPLRSVYFASPSTVLNLLRYRSVDDLRYTVSKSLASFLDQKEADRLQKDAKQSEAELSTKKADPATQRRIQKRIRRQLRSAEALRKRQLEILNRSLEGLERLGHLEEGKLTAKGYWAANLCTSLVLELAEAIDRGLFSNLMVEELAALVASISGTKHKTYLSIRQNPISKDLFKEMQKIIDDVKEAYEKPPGIQEVFLSIDAATTVVSWMEAESWLEFAGILRLAGVAEGDVARLVSQTADHLHQISRLYETHPELAACAEEARGRILRPPLSEVLAATQLEQKEG